MSKSTEPNDGVRAGTVPAAWTLPLRRTLGLANVVGAFVIAVALTVNITDRMVQGIFNPGHYFQYFTIQTCIINIVVLTIGGMFALMRRNDPHWYAVVRASTVAYAVVVGVIYNVLLAGLSINDGYISTFEFPNLVQHVWGPILIAAEWVLMPGRARLGWRVLWIAAVYPFTWVAASIGRGLVGDGWFPYFFLNPAEMGWDWVGIYVGGIAAFIITVTAVAILIGRVHGRVFGDLGRGR
jgi:hypothetical protein